jgi:hypothetical protein
MRITTEPRSDQWNADDFVGGPRTFTIAGVKTGAAEQKYDIEMVEGEGRVWRPPLTVLRLLVAAWGDDATTWVGRRVRLYRDAEISFGRDKVGGIRMSHMSDIDGPLSIMLTATRGKRTNNTVQPLPAPTPAERVATLKAEWHNADPERQKAIEAEAARLTQTPAESSPAVKATAGGREKAGLTAPESPAASPDGGDA